jgi:hypothetical protein
MKPNRNDPFKMGISIGMSKGQKQFFTGVDDCPKAIHDANKYIHEKFDPGFSIYFVNDNDQERRRTRRRR